jgi:hypothetical protein
VIPSPWVAVVLALAGHRLMRLAGWDDLPIILRARTWVNGGVDGVQWGRPSVAHFVGCAYCLGFWISLVEYLVWVAAGHPGAMPFRSWMLYPAGVLALSSAVGIISRTLDP